MLRSALAVMAVIALLPRIAVAADLPTIAVVGIHHPGESAKDEADAIASVVAAIEASGQFDALDARDVQLRIAGREGIVLEEAFFGPGRRLLGDGRVLYESAAAEDALPTLEEAVDTLRGGMATANSTRDLWEAWMYLGVARWATDDTEGAQQAWASAISLQPRRNPDQTRFPPDVVSAFEAVRTGLVDEPSSLVIQADLPGTEISVNGEPVGVTPAVASSLIPGETHITGRGPGGETGYVAVVVDPASAATVALPMGNPSLGKAGATKVARQKQATALYRSLGSRADVDGVLIIGTFEDRLFLQIYSSAADAFSTPLSVPYADDPVDEARTAAGSVLGLVQADGSLPGDQTVPNAIPIDIGANPLLASMLLSPNVVMPGGPKQGKGTPWGLIGAGGGGAIAIAAGIIVAVAAGGQDPNQGTIRVGPLP